MYPEGSVLDIHFPAERLIDMAGDPYWIDLTVEEATVLVDMLRARFEPGQPAQPEAMQNIPTPNVRPTLILT